MFLVLIIIVSTALYFYSVRNHDYWKKRNVKHEAPLPLIGNHIDNLFGIKGMIETSVELYNKYREEKIIGYYRGTTPELIVKDLELIKKIMATDFPYFYNRGLSRNPDIEPTFGNLFHAEGDRWRLLRQRLTPAFTTAKLKAMFPLVVRCAESLQDVVMELASHRGTYDARELMARFTTEFIGACGFGIEMNSINNEHSSFRELGRIMFTRSLRNRLLLPIWELFPEVRNILRVDPDAAEKGITAIVKQIRHQRKYQPIGRHDFIDLLLELEKKGKIVGESIEKFDKDGAPETVEMEMDPKCQMAQVFIFFAAGFETSSSATSYTLHVLAYNPEIQRRVQDEIDSVMKKYDNKLCYDAIAEMSLLDMAFQEAMRMFPSVGVLNRICTRQYTIPDLGITIDPGVKILIPVQAIQMDEKYFDNPKEFRPERFTPEEKRKRHAYTYLPFGAGPRACIGERLGHMQSLAGLAALLHRVTVEPAASSRREIRVHPLSNTSQQVAGGIPLTFTPRRTSHE
ncbi:cytochrome P450 6B6-like [Pectinophora gossypiella]|uniref:cytochrome P450 6B6-like n=1 Tax=Pectinophora gossypiella TaxID=13191 RepID=UPI00214F1609|nr:cytochrome P450 6B6-like [Pectinophora gossypiella]